MIGKETQLTYIASVAPKHKSTVRYTKNTVASLDRREMIAMNINFSKSLRRSAESVILKMWLTVKVVYLI